MEIGAKMKELLVIVDVQNDFVDGALGSPEAQAIIPAILDKINGWSGDIIFTQDTHKENYADTLEGKHLPVKHCLYRTKGWRIKDELTSAAAGHYAVLYKDTFGSINLGWECATGEYSRIEIVGLCTDICVISNALLLKSFCPETEIYVDAKCCAGTTPEKHNMALKIMESCQINILS